MPIRGLGPRGPAGVRSLGNDRGCGFGPLSASVAGLRVCRYAAQNGGQIGGSMVLGRGSCRWLLAFCLVLVQTALASAGAVALRVAPAEIASTSEDKVILLDARPKVDYDAGHLPGARHLPVSATFENLSQNGRVIGLAQAQALFRGLGIRVDVPVVVYDSGSLVDAARVFWTLEVYGHPQVRLLDGGVAAWQQAGLPLSTEVPRVAPSEYVPTINPKRIATRFSTLLASRQPQRFTVIDARDAADYLGQQSKAPRFGHIPQARNIPVHENLDTASQSLRPVEELRTLYQNIPSSHSVITYCHTGKVSALTYVALRELGFDVANYDASWTEWGADPALPIINARGELEPR